LIIALLVASSALPYICLNKSFKAPSPSGFSAFNSFSHTVSILFHFFFCLELEGYSGTLLLTGKAVVGTPIPVIYPLGLSKLIQLKLSMAFFNFISIFFRPHV